MCVVGVRTYSAASADDSEARQLLAGSSSQVRVFISVQTHYFRLRLHEFIRQKSTTSVTHITLIQFKKQALIIVQRPTPALFL